ncbi:hypothetical protein CYL16_06840 [Mycobacterium sp. EPG1]|nr:hypothetical protein CYL16_06840 [Mycobacterium sp. EPG1]
MSANSGVNETSFGYLPDFECVDQVLDRGSFARAVVLGTPVKGLATAVAECRVYWESAGLPEGVYWFHGVPGGSILLQVADGEMPADATESAGHGDLDDEALGEAWQWAEHYWHLATPVPQPRFNIDRPAVMRPGDVDVVIRDRKFLTNQWQYTVVIDGRSTEVLEARLNDRPEMDDPRRWVSIEPAPASRFGATLTRAKLEGKFANTLFSFRASRTIFRPYQFKPVMKLLQTGKARLLIADEVGLGKTIEAGLIWTELEVRQEADRVLVVCPSSLVGKWREEMDDRFGCELLELDNSALSIFLERHRQNRLPRRQAYVCSLERLRTWDGLDELKEVPPEFDLVIVDEAHAMRNQDTKSYSLGAQLSEWADNLVFLTATPINLGQSDLLTLLELLAPEDFGDTRDLELRLEANKILNTVAARLGQRDANGIDLITELRGLRDTTLGDALMRRPDFTLLVEILSKGTLEPRDIVAAKRFVAELNTLSTVITRTKKVEVDDRKAKRTEDRRNVEWTDEETQFYREYLNWCIARARDMGMPLYFAMQMPLRLASACLPMARKAVLDPASFDAIADQDSDVPAGRIEPHPELVEAAKNLPGHVDTKFDQLYRVLSELWQKRKRALLFTFSRPTLTYLQDRLGEDFRVAVMHGGVSREGRRRIMAEFRSGEYDFVLANRVASEGLDFEFCSAVINYDLPWNPMEIEQRIGRIDRIGQQDEAILVVNFVNEMTIDERIVVRLLDRIEIFESSIGALEPIISATASAVLQAGFDFSLSEEQRQQKMHEALTAIEEQRAGLRDVSDASSALLVSNDVDIAGLEDDLVRTGSYIGQNELALLLDDWARVDDATGVRPTKNNAVVEFLGNPTMAARVDQLAHSARRTRAETAWISAQLRNETPIHLVVDQEHARKYGGTLLSATSPLVMAATSVPGNRQARFASLALSADSELVTPGTYVIVVAKAVAEDQRGDEIWGAATAAGGRNGGEAPFNALLAALAEGRLADATLPEVERLELLADRALNQLSLKYARERVRREHEFHALQEARKATLRDQHKRRVATIERRILTARQRSREPRSIALFESQMRRAHERYDRLSAELDSATAPDVRLEPVAACVIQVSASEVP